MGKKERKEEKQIKIEKKRKAKKNGELKSKEGASVLDKERAENLIRILSTDIPGHKKVYAGLTRIKGISWALSNAICQVLRIDKKRKIESLTKEEISKITKLVEELAKGVKKIPEFLMNRRFDVETGQNRHIFGTELELRKEFDIKKLKKIRSYKGIRHSTGLPVRGQRTRAHFRKNRVVGVIKKGLKKK